MNLNLTHSEVKSDIIKRFQSLTPASAALWGKMNAAQMIAHCHAQVSVTLGEKKLPFSFLGLLFGKMIKKKVLAVEPYSHNLPTAPLYKIAETPEFETTRNKLIAAIQKFEVSKITTESHPIFGKMTADEWATSTWKHLDHHLKQFGK
jgi:Protein of unknown function (DUF1569)